MTKRPNLSVGHIASVAGAIVSGGLIGSAISAEFKLLPIIVLIALIPFAIYAVQVRRVVVGFLCVILYLNISDSLMAYHGLISTNKILIPAILALLAWHIWRERGPQPAVVVALVLGVLNFGVAAASLLYAEDTGGVLEELGRRWKDIAVMLIMAGLLWERMDLRVVSLCIFASGAIISALAIYAYLQADPTNELSGFIRWQEQDRDGTAPSLRISGPVGDPNFFAQILLIPMALGLFFAFKATNLILRIAGFIGLALIVCGIATTLSRGGFISALITAILFLFWGVNHWRSRGLVFLCALVVAVVGAYAAPEEIQVRFLELVETFLSIFDPYNIPDESTSGRLDEMMAAVYMFLDNPLFGVGLHNYSFHFQDYSLNHGLMVRGSDRAAHSLYLEIAAEQGLLGLTAFFILIFVVFRVGFGALRRQRAAGHDEQANLIFALILAYAGYLFAGILLHGVHLRYFWLLTGLLLATGNLISQRSRS